MSQGVTPCKTRSTPHRVNNIEHIIDTHRCGRTPTKPRKRLPARNQIGNKPHSPIRALALSLAGDLVGAVETAEGGGAARPAERTARCLPAGAASQGHSSGRYRAVARRPSRGMNYMYYGAS